MKLHGKVAVITGGSKGIGFGCARVFGKHGCRVVFGARGGEAGRAAEKELANAGSPAGVLTPLLEAWASSQFDPKQAMEADVPSAARLSGGALRGTNDRQHRTVVPTIQVSPAPAL